jgi:hypothetical protein
VIVLGLLACGGARVAVTEAVWSGPASELEAAVGLELVDLPSGNPAYGEPPALWLDSAPRIVAYPDRIEVDDRAWFASLPEEIRRSLPTDSGPPLVVAPVVDGRLPAPALEGALLSGLHAQLQAMATRQEAVGRATGNAALAFPGRIVLVPDRHTSSALLDALLVTARAARFPHVQVLGASEGRLRPAATWSPTLCAVHVDAHLSPDDVHLTAADVGLRGNTCPLPPAEVPTVIGNLADTCEPLLRHQPPARLEGASPRCVTVRLVPDPDTTVEAVLPGLFAIEDDARSHLALPPEKGRGGTTARPGCDDRVRIDALTASQKNAVCGAMVREGPPLTGPPPARRRWKVVDVEVRADGQPAPDELQRLRRYAGQIRYCAERNAPTDAAAEYTLDGRLSVADGRVDTAAWTHPVAEVATCVDELASRWRFPASRQGTLRATVVVRAEERGSGR